MPNGAIDPQQDYVAELATQSKMQWPTIVTAQADAIAVQQLLRDKLRSFMSDDVDVVVFGSLARREWTSGSDVDWTLLVDGQASPDHRALARSIRNVLSMTRFRDVALLPPGGEGIFGNMAFSHEVIHNIGGQADTNRNTTQRVL